MKIFNAGQIKEIDQFTIEKEPISSAQLMERAAGACASYLLEKLTGNEAITIVCGMGNNGGDGLALGRLLLNEGRNVKIFLVKHIPSFSHDAQLMFRQLKTAYPKSLTELHTSADLFQLENPKPDLVIDALLGTGVNKPAEGLLAEAIACINALHPATIYSIDMPSGLYPDQSSAGIKHIVKADLVLSFQFPKLAFLLAENGSYVKDFNLLNIGLHPDAIAVTPSYLHYTSRDLIQALLLRRSKFSHKGSFGHALLLAGSQGKSGAAIIAAKACMRSGAGLLTVHSTKDTLEALLGALPEAMSSCDREASHISGIEHLQKYSAVAFGPGVGQHEDTQRVLKKILQYCTAALIIDADGLNLLAENKTWLEFLPANSILSPHVKEFDRMTRIHQGDFERLQSLKEFSQRYRSIVILKSAHTVIAMPDGNLFFNSTGNPGLAKAGSGDGLTGVILGLLCRGYTAPQAALLGVYVHGLAADRMVRTSSHESLLISDVIGELPEAFKELEDHLLDNT